MNHTASVTASYIQRTKMPKLFSTTHAHLRPKNAHARARTRTRDFADYHGDIKMASDLELFLLLHDRESRSRSRTHHPHTRPCAFFCVSSVLVFAIGWSTEDFGLYCLFFILLTHQIHPMAEACKDTPVPCGDFTEFKASLKLGEVML